MHKVLYFMHVPWSWIKQRPQFLAEQLSQYFNVTVIDFYSDKRNKNALLNKQLVFKSLIKLTQANSGFLYRLQIYLKMLQIGYTLLRSKIIWLSSPNQYHFVKFFLTKRHFVIYDCMDDIIAFYNLPEVRQSLTQLERKILIRSNLVISSSEHLKKVLLERHQINKTIAVVNNAVNINITTYNRELPVEISTLFNDKQYKYLVYIGTVSVWFDFELIETSLKNTNVRVLIFGPKEVEFTESKYIKYGGILQHNHIASVMQFSDALVMPFRLIELVLSVNPVKAYEYISSGKPTILVKYPETEKFKDYAYLYSSSQEFQDIIDLLDKGWLCGKKDIDSCLSFAKCNTWESRTLKILENINKSFPVHE